MELEAGGEATFVLLEVAATTGEVDVATVDAEPTREGGRR